jgi:hypothetical protein
MTRLSTILLSILLAALPVSSNAQQNMLVGVWQASQPASQAGPANSVTLSFLADGRYQFQQAFAGRGDGSASGVVTAVGVYRLTGPNQIQWQVHSAQMCAGGACQPRPDLVSSGTMNFTFADQNRMITNGTTFFRIG